MMIVETPVAFMSQGALLRGLLLNTRNRRATPCDCHHGARHLGDHPHGSDRVRALVLPCWSCSPDLRPPQLRRSDGEPRHEINPWIQCRGYRDALDFAVTRPEVDPSRLAIWGDSYTGGQVIVVSACDSTASRCRPQCPVFGSSVPSIDPALGTHSIIRETLESGYVRGTPETTTDALPVVSADQAGTPSLLAPIQAFRWFIDYGGRPGSMWENRVTRVLPATPVPYLPFLWHRSCRRACSSWRRQTTKWCMPTTK